MIEVYTGEPGSGKSNKLAQTLIEVLNRNVNWYAKSGIKRMVYTNFHLSAELEELYKGVLRHWSDIEELVILEDVDVFIDEIFSFFDAKHWQELSFSARRWLSQHRKIGVEIYGNCQDFAQIDVAFRRMTKNLFYLVKLFGSGEPSPTKPPIKRIWGVCIVYRMNPRTYKEDQKDNGTSFNDIMFITRKNCEVFNMREKIMPGKFPPLQHTERACETCGVVKVIHQ